MRKENADYCDTFFPKSMKLEFSCEDSFKNKFFDDLNQIYTQQKTALLSTFNPFPNNSLDPSKLKEFAEDNFKFDEKWQKVLQMGRKHCGKRRNCSLRAISPFPFVFSIDWYNRHIKTSACLGKG